MARKARNAFYSNNEKTQIECEFILDDGTVSRAVVNKSSTAENGSENPDWKWVHEQCGEDNINKKTEEVINSHRAKQADDEAKREREAGEMLFNMKLKAFEIDEIRASKNTKMKAKIRRADDPAKVNIYAAALVAMELSKPEEVEPEPLKKVVVDVAPEPIKPPRKKRAPRKKAAKKHTLVDNIKED